MWGKGDRFLGGEEQSLFDLREKAIVFLGVRVRSLFGVGKRRSGLWVVSGDLYCCHVNQMEISV